MAPWMLPAATLAGSLITNALNLREAGKNRRFQERMSSTAHQREVADLRRAGLNPMMAMRMSGASAPSGDRAELEDSVSKGVSTALQAKLIKAQTGLLEDQAHKTRVETGRLTLEANAGLFERFRAQSEEAVIRAQNALARVEAEIAQMGSAARANRARAALDELLRTGAVNVEAFERDIGEMGPAMRFFLNLIRGLR